MLIDLYERPYSPEASRSRAFIDSILALSGPDGGVVGGEDGVSTQRPLKDGGREAWDMIRRLRQKAWQKAGLNPQMLWTEQDQIQAGVASPADNCGDESPLHSGPAQPGSPSSAMAGRPSAHKPQPNDSKKPFYKITRSHTPSNHIALATKSPLRCQSQSQPQGDSLPAVSNPLFDSDPASCPASPRLNSASPNVASFLDAPLSMQHPASTISAAPVQHLSSDISASGNASFNSPNVLSMGVPTPPSMVDPNLNFDWDQWDAVFGQHLPVADDLMELDPVSGLDITHVSMNNGNSPIDIFNSYGNGPPGSTAEGNMPSWSGNSADDWAGYF